MLRRSIFVVGICSLAVGCSASEGSSSESVAGSASVAPATTELAAPTEPTSSAIPITTTTASSIETTMSASVGLPSCTATLDLPTTGTIAPEVRCWEIPEPGPIGIVSHPSACCEWLVLSHGGTQVETFGMFYGTAPEFGLLGSIVPTDESGTPLALRILDTSVLAALGVSADGRLVWLDPWTLTAGSIPHPGRISDVALSVWAAGASANRETDANFWAVGFDGETPVLWYDTGLHSVGWQNAVLSGQSIATVVAAGEPNATGPALVAADQDFSYALLPELDGTSRLWIASKPELGEPAQRTDLVFSEPTGITVSFTTVWVSDRDGLHAIGLRAEQRDSGVLMPVPDDQRTVSTDPLRVLEGASAGARDGSVFVVDPNGRVLHATDTGTLDELLNDPELTDVHLLGNNLLAPDLFVSHGASDQFIIADRGCSENSTSVFQLGVSVC